jgi:hypothetical protein
MAEKVELWWLSFADPGLPEGSQFLGVVILEAAGLADAVTKSHLLGLNPGGEILGYPVPGWIPREWQGRLLTKEEAVAADETLDVVDPA